MGNTPTRDDLLAVAAFANLFARTEFVAGEWVKPSPREDGVIQLGWWSASKTVADWERALYDYKIIDPDSDYLSRASIEYVNRAIADPRALADADLPKLRRALTFLARAERHTGGGWYERAFASGMAQAATKRLGELARSVA